MRWERRGPIPAAAARSAQCAAAERTAETEAGSNFLPSPSKPAPRPRYTTGDGFQIDSKVLPGSAALGHPHQLPVSPKRAGGCTAHREEVSAPGRQRCAVQSAKRGGGAATPPSPAPPHPRASPAGSPSRADPCSGAPRTPPGRAAAWPRPSSSWPQPRSPRAATAFFPLLLLFLLLRAGRPRRGPAQRRLPEHLRRPPRPAPALIARRRRRRGAPGGGGGGAAAGAGGEEAAPPAPPPSPRARRAAGGTCVCPPAERR